MRSVIDGFCLSPKAATILRRHPLPSSLCVVPRGIDVAGSGSRQSVSRPTIFVPVIELKREEAQIGESFASVRGYAMKLLCSTHHRLRSRKRSDRCQVRGSKGGFKAGVERAHVRTEAVEVGAVQRRLVSLPSSPSAPPFVLVESQSLIATCVAVVIDGMRTVIGFPPSA